MRQCHATHCNHHTNTDTTTHTGAETRVSRDGSHTTCNHNHNHNCSGRRHNGRRLAWVGVAGVAVTMPAEATATPLTLWHQLGLGPEHQGADEPPAGVRVAINQQFAAWEAPLADGDELAFLPPISGG